MAAANSTKTAAGKTAETPKETKPDRTTLTLQQKFVEIRKAIPAIQQQAHSDGVKYKFAKIYDVYKLMAPALNEWGVNFDITEETATRHAENGDEIYYSNCAAHKVWRSRCLDIRGGADDPVDERRQPCRLHGCHSPCHRNQ